jgi:hypothetical protein
VATGFTDESDVCETLTEYAHDADQEPARVGVLPFVESKRLLIEVSEQVKRFDTDIGAFDRALQERPEVLVVAYFEKQKEIGMKMTEAQVVKIDELSRKGYAIACEAFHSEANGLSAITATGNIFDAKGMTLDELRECVVVRLTEKPTTIDPNPTLLRVGVPKPKRFGRFASRICIVYEWCERLPWRSTQRD